jgi:glycosyltransferase involved in cell wall biosynthesis
MRQTLSVAMIAMNEEANLPRTLESVRWADEIIVVDSGSKDRTIEIARSFGAKTTYHAFGGHGEQKNVALDLCTSDWTLLLDADEVLTPALQEEIRQLLACADGREPEFNAYWIPRLNLYFGRWIRHGGFYPDRKLRLFKTGSARLSEGVGPHSTPQFTGPKGQAQGRHAPLRLSNIGNLSRTHGSIQLRHRSCSRIRGAPASRCRLFSGTPWQIPLQHLSITIFFGWAF